MYEPNITKLFKNPQFKVGTSVLEHLMTVLGHRVDLQAMFAVSLRGVADRLDIQMKEYYI